VDLAASTVQVRHALQRLDGKLTLTEPKTQRSRRTLRIPNIAARAFRSQRVRQGEERLLAGERWHDLNFVFATSIGTPLDARNVIRHFDHALSSTGLQPAKKERDAI